MAKKKVKTKLKTKKILAKKIKITSTGKILRSHQLRSGHLRRHKSKGTLRRHQQSILVEKRVARVFRRLLGKG